MLGLLASSPLLTIMLVVALGAAFGMIPFGPLKLGAAGALLVELFGYFGREVVSARFPQLVAAASWQLASGWLDDYGLLALMLVAASPMPQTPVVFFYALGEPSVAGTLIAIGVGKSVKYVFLAWLSSHYPARFAQYR